MFILIGVVQKITFSGVINSQDSRLLVLLITVLYQLLMNIMAQMQVLVPLRVMLVGIMRCK
jgi:hypothetical protein